MKIKNRLFLLLTFILLLFPLNTFASTNTFDRDLDNLRIPSIIEVTENNKQIILNTPSVNETEKIYDFANLFSDIEEKSLYDLSTDYINKYNMDLVIVTISSNNKSSTRDYGMDFYDYNMFGTDNKRSGILLVIDMENRRYEMVTTGEAIIMYDDNRIDNILDFIINDFKLGNYFDACSSFINQSDYYASKGIPTSNKYATVDEYGNITVNRPTPYIILIVIDLIITSVIIAILVGKNKMVKKRTEATEYMIKDSKNIRTVSEVFLGANVSKVRIQTSSSGGGSSTRSGSSGHSHGGGGRSF